MTMTISRPDPAKLRVFGCAQRNILRAERRFADSAGNMSAYRASGVVAGKRWITGAGCCDLCEALDGVEVPLDADFPDGGDCPPLHPQCRCACTPVLAEENSD